MSWFNYFPKAPHDFIVVHCEVEQKAFYINIDNILYFNTIGSKGERFGEITLRDNFVVVCDETAPQIKDLIDGVRR